MQGRSVSFKKRIKDSPEESKTDLGDWKLIQKSKYWIVLIFISDRFNSNKEILDSFDNFGTSLLGKSDKLNRKDMARSDWKKRESGIVLIVSTLINDI